MNKIKAVIFGATGMVGKAILLECLEDDRVDKVLCVVRNKIKTEHQKLEQVVCHDFENLSELNDKISGYNACFYAIGIPSSGLSEENYNRITYDYTISAANMLLENNRDLVFCYVSAKGAVSNQRSNRMWANIRGKTENSLQTYPFKAVYSFRPGYIQPMKGVKSQVFTYRLLYAFTSQLYFFFKHIPSFACSSVEFGKAMINAAYFDYHKSILESKDIVRLSKSINQ